MTKDDVIRLAKEADLTQWDEPYQGTYSANVTSLWRFAKLVAEHEREACAKVCEEHPDGLTMTGGAFVTCAAAIRARGQNER